MSKAEERIEVDENLISEAEQYAYNQFVNQCLEKGACDQHDLKEAYIAGAVNRIRREKQYSLEAVREDFPDGTIVLSTKNLIDDDLEARGIEPNDKINLFLVKL